MIKKRIKRRKEKRGKWLVITIVTINEKQKIYGYLVFLKRGENVLTVEQGNLSHLKERSS